MIKNAITDRELAPGTKLSEEALGKALKVSRTPIRSALRRLSYEMYVTIIPRRGAFVSEPTPKEVKDVFEMRLLLEDYAVQKACQNYSRSQQVFEEVEEMVRKELRAYQANSIRDVLSHVYDIHVEIAKLSNNEILIKQLRELISLTNIYLTFYSEMKLNDPRSPQEHLEILKAIKANDVDMARKLMRGHIEGILSRLNFGIIERNTKNIESVLEKYS